MDRGSGESRFNPTELFDDVEPAEEVGSKPLDYKQFAELSETTEQRARKLQKEREAGVVPQKPLYKGMTPPVAIEQALKQARSLAESSTPSFEQIVQTKQPTKEQTPVLQQVKSFFGKVGGFFKKSFGAKTETSREVRIQFPPLTPEKGLEKPSFKSATEYIDAYFAIRPGLQAQFENNSKTPFETFKNEQAKKLEAKLVSHRASVESGTTKDQDKLDAAINRGIYTQLEGNELFKKNGSPDIDLFEPKGRTVRIETPQDTETEEKFEKAA